MPIEERIFYTIRLPNSRHHNHKELKAIARATIKITIKDPLGKHVGTILFTLLAVVMLNPTILTSMAAGHIGEAYIVASLVNRFLGIISHHGERNKV